MKLEVKAIKMLNIYEKESLYVTIGEGETKVVIRVGEENFNKIQALLGKQPTNATGQVAK